MELAAHHKEGERRISYHQEGGKISKGISYCGKRMAVLGGKLSGGERFAQGERAFSGG